jgi:hypothetical protein
MNCRLIGGLGEKEDNWVCGMKEEEKGGSSKEESWPVGS